MCAITCIHNLCPISLTYTCPYVKNILLYMLRIYMPICQGYCGNMSRIYMTILYTQIMWQYYWQTMWTYPLQTMWTCPLQGCMKWFVCEHVLCKVVWNGLGRILDRILGRLFFKNILGKIFWVKFWVEYSG